MGINTGINTLYIMKERRQFHYCEVVRPLEPSMVTPEIYKRTLKYLIFLMKKRNVNIKGRGCANGFPQKVYKSKLEISLPTVSSESVFIGYATNVKTSGHDARGNTGCLLRWTHSCFILLDLQVHARVSPFTVLSHCMK